MLATMILDALLRMNSFVDFYAHFFIAVMRSIDHCCGQVFTGMYDYAVDIFSVGALMYVVLRGQLPPATLATGGCTFEVQHQHNCLVSSPVLPGCRPPAPAALGPRPSPWCTQGPGWSEISRPAKDLLGAYQTTRCLQLRCLVCLQRSSRTQIPCCESVQLRP